MIQVSRIHLSSTFLQSQVHLYLRHQSMLHNPLTKAYLKLSHSPSIRHMSLLSSKTHSKITMWLRTATLSCLNNSKIPRLHLKGTPISRLLLHSMVTPQPTTTMMLKTCSSKYHNKLNFRRMHNLLLLLECWISLASTKTFEKKNNFLFDGSWLVLSLDFQTDELWMSSTWFVQSSRLKVASDLGLGSWAAQSTIDKKGRES